MRPEAFMVAGPNGAGKTTYVNEFLEEDARPFLNADLLAEELNPEQPWKAQVAAARLLFEQLDELVEARQSFVLETTLSGQSLRKRVAHWQEQGYLVHMVFLVLESPEQHVRRVQHRVNVGRHHVPDADVIRRYYRSIANFREFYSSVLAQWEIITCEGSNYQRLALKRNGAVGILERTLVQQLGLLPPSDAHRIAEPDFAWQYGDDPNATLNTMQAAANKAIQHSWKLGVPVVWFDRATGREDYVWPDGSVTHENPYRKLIEERFGPDHPAITNP